MRSQLLKRPIDRPIAKPMLARTMLLAAIVLAAAGCAKPASVLKPCGVIEDSLRDVEGKTRADQQRIDTHFERGVRASCWER